MEAPADSESRRDEPLGTSVAIAPEIPDALEDAAGPFTELRVHGAGGAELTELLDTADVVRVAGAEDVGFYRPRGDRHDDLEAYQWGQFNSGGGWRALWVLLIPFLLANFGGWLAERDGWRGRLGRPLVRVFGLLITGVFVYWVAAIFVDIVALQCGGQPHCVDNQWWLFYFDWGVFDGHPGRRMVVGLVVPVALTFVLWNWPGRRSADATDRFPRPSAPPKGEANLSRDYVKLWHSEGATRRLARLHLVGALALLAMMTALVTNTVDRSGAGTGLSVAAGLVLAGVVARVALGVSSDPLGDEWWERYDVRAWLAGGGLLVLAAAYAWLADVAAAADPALLAAGLEGEASTVWVTRTLGVRFSDLGFRVVGVPLFLTLAILFLLPKRGRPYLGWGPALASAASLVVLAAMLTGAGLWVTELLGERRGAIDDALGRRGFSREVVLDPAELAEEVDALLDAGFVEDLADRRASTGDEAAELERLHEERKGALERLLLAQECANNDAAESCAALGSADVDSLRAELARATADYQVAEADFSELEQTARDNLAAVAQPQLRLFSSYDISALGVLAILAAVALYYLGWVKLRTRLQVWARAVNERKDKSLGWGRCGDGNPTPPRSRTPREIRLWRRAIARKIRQSPERKRSLGLIAVVGIASIVCFTWYLYDVGLNGGRLTLAVTSWLDWSLDAARWVVTAAVLGTAAVIRSAYRGGAQSLGGIWDVSIFMPRLHHPFAPPSYGVRAVPEIKQRLDQLTAPGRSAVLSPHSQGVPVSLAAVAAVRCPERLGVISYGSPTGALHARLLPDYLGPEQLALIADQLAGEEDSKPRWVNLWRITDWTGGYAFGPPRDQWPEDPKVPPSRVAGEVDNQLVDPAPAAIANATSSERPLPAPAGHHFYRDTPEYQRVLCEYEELLRERAALPN